jgi:hypothetical protein
MYLHVAHNLLIWYHRKSPSDVLDGVCASGSLGVTVTVNEACLLSQTSCTGTLALR